MRFLAYGFAVRIFYYKEKKDEREIINNRIFYNCCYINYNSNGFS